MFRRKLTALNSPVAESFDAGNEDQYRTLVVWLEDQKIRHLKIEDRGPIRDIASSEWPKLFQSYLTTLKCPYEASDRASVLDWLLGCSVRLEYGDNTDKYKEITPERVQQARSRQQAGPSSNPLDNLSFEDPDFKAGVMSLAMLLKVPPHQDHLEQLKAICILVKDKLSQEALKEKAEQKDQKDEHIPIEKTDLGFDTGNNIINEVAKIVRLLHIKELRDLQTQINAAIVAVQAIIANPKTDSRLGQVGR